jgi:type VI secretion system protein
VFNLCHDSPEEAEFREGLVDSRTTVTLTLEIISTPTGMPSARQRSFREGGGRIGRDKSNDWVLPHAKVSSKHAVISYRNGVFLIEDRSRNGVFLNSTTNRLTPGKPQALQSGDVLFIEPYEIQVSITEEASDSALGFDQQSDPFVERPLAAPPPYAAPLEAAEPVPGDDEFNYEVDPMKLLGGGPDQGERRQAPNKDVVNLEELERRPLAGAYQPPRIVTPPPVPAPSPLQAPQPESMSIPEDYDPLKDEIVSDAEPNDPFAAAPAAPDPFEARAPRREVEPEPALLQEHQVRTTPPPAPRAAPPVSIEAAADPFAALPERTDADADAGTPAPAPHVEVPVVEEAPPAAAPVVPLRHEKQTAPPPTPAPAEPPSAPVTPAVTAPARGERAEVKAETLDLSAMLAGAGLHNVDVTPELAESFGRILTVVVAGVMDLLRARQQVKDELRMRQTQFRPVDNNPLKFSANVEDAMHNLLVKRNAAYLKPVEAFTDAFDDLRDHQLAMLAGLRVAFEAMLADFDPARLEEQFDRQLKKGALLSVPAKLRYWDAYRDRTQQLLQDMDATFRKWFGDEFVKAYEEQLERLEVERRERTP